MRIFVINLQGSDERLRFISDALGELGLPFDRIPAVDGRLIPEAERLAFAASRPGYRWTPGEIGCLFSHAEAWRRASERPDGWTVILEDDVRLSPSLPGLLALLDRLPAEIDVCRFEASIRRRVWLGAEFARIDDVGFYILASKVMGAAAYAIRGHAAARLLEMLSMVKGPVDEIFMPGSARTLRLMVAQTVPVFAEQTLEGSSTINPERKGRPKTSAAARIWREVRRPLKQALNAARMSLTGHRPIRLRLP